MAQHDYSIANQGFPATRADINNVLSAISTNNSGTSAPSTQYAGQFWIDTTSSTWTLYIHDGADDIQFATIDTSANTVNFTDSALDVVTDTTPQLGGNLDLNSNDITGTGNINITGTGTFSGDLTVDTSTLKVDSTNNRVGIGTTSPASELEIESATPEIRIDATSGASRNYKIHSDGDELYIEGIGSSGSLKIGEDGTYGISIDLGTGGIQASDGIYLGGTGTANKLDDYEEGTFTPTVIGSTSGSFTTGDSATKGSYVKIGNQVTVKGEIHITGSSSPVGSLTVGNLPFANAFLTELSERTTGSCWLKYIDLESGARNVTPFITQGNSSFVFYETNDNAAITAVNSSEVTVPGAEFAFSLTYQTS
jgi:hypothetical protein